MIPAPFWKGTAFAPIALLTHTQKTGTGVSAPETSPAIDTTGATLLVVAVASYGTFSISDSNANTWLTAVSKSYSLDTNLVTRLMYAQSPATVGAGHTFTVDSLGTAFAVASFSNVGATPLDQSSSIQVVASNASGGPASITPTQNSELILGVDGTEPTVTNVTDASSPTALVEVEQIHGSGGNFYGVILAYGVQNALATESVNFSWTGGNINLLLAASFKHA